MVGLDDVVRILDLSMQGLLRAFAFLLQFGQSYSVKQYPDIGHVVGHGGDQGRIVQVSQAQVAGTGIQLPREWTELGRSHRVVGLAVC